MKSEIKPVAIFFALLGFAVNSINALQRKHFSKIDIAKIFGFV